LSLPAQVPSEVAAAFAALALSPDPVFATDRRNRIVFWNRSAEHLLGYAGDDVVGGACAELLQGRDVHENRYCSETCPVTQMAARSEVIRQFDLRLRAKDGHAVTVDVSILSFITGPEQFFLAHILKPSAQTTALTLGPNATPPRSQLVAVRSSADARARKLTEREVEVLGMLAAGHPTPEIAQRLHISSLTARNHIQNILDKLEVHSKAEAVAFAFQKHIF
jgi:PAS domain S-box-containing protein